MKKAIILSAGLAAFMCLGTTLQAQEEGGGEDSSSITVEDGSCQNQCPEGQVKVTFADGAKVSCACSEQSTGMVETVESEGGGCADANDDGACDE